MDHDLIQLLGYFKISKITRTWDLRQFKVECENFQLPIL